MAAENLDNESILMRFLTKAPERRPGPGRPSSKPPLPCLIVKGVSDKPINSQNSVEFVYARPIHLKSITEYLKAVKSEEVHFRFLRGAIMIYAMDHAKVARIITGIDCRTVSWYSLAGDPPKADPVKADPPKAAAPDEKVKPKIHELDIKPDICALMTVCQAISEEHFGMMLSINREIETELVITFICQPKYNKITTNKIAMTVVDSKTIDFKPWDCYLSPKFNDSLPISFEIGTKSFKTDLSNIAKIDPKFIIEKIGTGPLGFSVKSNKIEAVTHVLSEKDINLMSKIKPNEIFTCHINLSDIKGLVSSMVADSVKVSCGPSGVIVFEFKIDSPGNEKDGFIAVKSIVDPTTAAESAR